ncbi:MAG: hypothetical protein ACR2LS_09475 [Thermomicrobiales bacterium]|jgi:hypothetical protein
MHTVTAKPTPGLSGRPTIPTERMLRRDRDIRFERGSPVYATDGRVGAIRQVVIDESALEVVALVVEIETTTDRVFLSPDLVDRTGGSAVFLSVTRQGFEALVEKSPAYQRDRFRKVKVKAGLRKRIGAAVGRPRRGIIQLGRDYIETPSGSSHVAEQRLSAVPTVAEGVA